jgi:hypothetical protein
VNILKQEYIVSNPFNKDMAITALKDQLESTIFDELIKNEKDHVKVTFLIEVFE